MYIGVWGTSYFIIFLNNFLLESKLRSARKIVKAVSFKCYEGMNISWCQTLTCAELGHIVFLYCIMKVKTWP